MVKALGEQVSALFPQEQKQEVDYKHKYELLTAYIYGVAAMTAESDDMSAEQATDAILSYMEQLNKK